MSMFLQKNVVKIYIISCMLSVNLHEVITVKLCLRLKEPIIVLEKME